MANRRNVVILGAAGRDFHTFNMVYRDDPGTRVVAFTMTQIPGVGDRNYPPELAGPHYPEGIPILDMSALDALVRDAPVDDVVFAYSDITHDHVMHVASRVLAAGADFRLFGVRSTSLRSDTPVIAITAVRTGSGKSPIARWLSRHLRESGHSVAVLRHPMPYGDLRLERVQRFAGFEDLDAARCTAEEREEYEPHLEFGNVVFAGVDYGAILAEAEREADLIIWDGGNNDFPFVLPDLTITVVDALRPDHLTSHHPGEQVLRSADVVVVNKVDATDETTVSAVQAAVREVNPTARQVLGASPITVEEPGRIAGARVLVVEDGPTTTHGGMPTGAGYAAALDAGAVVVDPRLSAAPLIAEVYEKYPHIGPVLPAVGYNADQIAALEETIDASGVEVVISGTPIDLARLLDVATPVVRARYEFAEAGEPTLRSIVDEWAAGITRT